MLRAVRNRLALRTCFRNHVDFSQICLSRNLAYRSFTCNLATPLGNTCLCQTTSRFKSSSTRKGDKNPKDINSLVQPVSVKPYNDLDGISVGEELAGSLKKGLPTVFLCCYLVYRVRECVNGHTEQSSSVFGIKLSLKLSQWKSTVL